MNNKNAMMKLMMVAVACVAMGTTAIAAPKGNKALARQEMRGGTKAPAKAQPKAPAKAPTAARVAKNDDRRGHDAVRHETRPVPRHEARPAKPVNRYHEPAPQKCHDRHDHHDNDGWLMLGAGVLGGIISAIAG